MLRADGFVSMDLKVMGNDNKPGASEGLSLAGTKIFISV